MVEFGIFVTPLAAEPDAVLDQMLAAERAGLDLVGSQDRSPGDDPQATIEHIGAELAPAARKNLRA